MSSRLLALSITSIAVVLAFLGCGGGEPQFDPATQYTPASLAQEIAFRCKTLDRSPASLDRLDFTPSKVGASTKGAPSTKAARTDTLDGLIAEVIEKTSKIPGLTHAQASKKVAEEVVKHPEISDEDKKAIKAKLEQVSD